jgi:hypothetical protein
MKIGSGFLKLMEGAIYRHIDSMKIAYAYFKKAG